MNNKGVMKKGLWEKLFSKRKKDGWAEKQMREMAKLGAKLVL
jgi:hypothetical protein